MRIHQWRSGWWSGVVCLLGALGMRNAAAWGAEPASQATAAYSQLWGQSGERWDEHGRLPDFSFAGYRQADVDLPRRAADLNVRDFGAVGDGEADDTLAFQRALAAAVGRVLRVPAGRYRITDLLQMSASGSVLQGDGAERSTLFFPRPLQDIQPSWSETTEGRRVSGYSWSGGFLTISGSFSSVVLAEVARPARRGDRTLVVRSVERLRSGDSVLLRLEDDSAASLPRHLYDEDPGSISQLRQTRVTLPLNVVAVDEATQTVTFDRPLRCDVRLAWKPRLFRGRSTAEEMGVEGLRFEFPATPYAGHFTEQGQNAIALHGARHCWFRDLQIHNADSGLFVAGINVTLQRLRFSSDRPPGPERQATGHHGLILNGQDQWLTDFEFTTRFMHDITMTRGSTGNVVSEGRGVDLCFDHHCYAPFANLFTAVDLGAGTRMFQSGGGRDLGRHAAAFTTFWNIRAAAPQSWPRGWSPDRINLVAVTTRDSAQLETEGRWLEPLSPAEIQPANLHAAQLARRRTLGGVRPATAR